MNIASPQPYTKVPFAELQAYLQNTASAEAINYIEVTDIEAEALFIDDENWENLENFEKPSLLGKILKQSGKKVALKLPKTVENLYSMHNCFWGCSTLVSLEAIPEGVVDMSFCFEACISLIKSPVIPKGVRDMTCCFFDCKHLLKAPIIHQGVEDMSQCFFGCINLMEAPAIPNGVVNMFRCFSNCISIIKAPEVPESAVNTTECFIGCENLTAECIRYRLPDWMRCRHRHRKQMRNLYGLQAH